MRVLLVGSATARARLRRELPSASVVGEFESVDEARSSGLTHDALLVASDAFEDDALRSSLRDPLRAPARGDRTIDDPLTPRELQVLELMALGLSNKAIAGRLDISDQTVKFHVAAIIGKLGASNRTEAVRRALRRGLIAL